LAQNLASSPVVGKRCAVAIGTEVGVEESDIEGNCLASDQILCWSCLDASSGEQNGSQQGGKLHDDDDDDDWVEDVTMIDINGCKLDRVRSVGFMRKLRNAVSGRGEADDPCSC
jgi:hypothetical protein